MSTRIGASPDTIHLSLDIEISDELRAKLESEKTVAQEADKGNAVHCPEWLCAQVLPHGARGGYSLLLETENFSVKILGSGIPNRPGLFLELRSQFLHTHASLSRARHCFPLQVESAAAPGSLCYGLGKRLIYHNRSPYSHGAA